MGQFQSQSAGDLALRPNPIPHNNLLFLLNTNKEISGVWFSKISSFFFISTPNAGATRSFGRALCWVAELTNFVWWTVKLAHSREEALIIVLLLKAIRYTCQLIIPCLITRALHNDYGFSRPHHSLPSIITVDSLLSIAEAVSFIHCRPLSLIGHCIEGSSYSNSWCSSIISILYSLYRTIQIHLTLASLYNTISSIIPHLHNYICSLYRTLSMCSSYYVSLCSKAWLHYKLSKT